MLSESSFLFFLVLDLLSDLKIKLGGATKGAVYLRFQFFISQISF